MQITVVKKGSPTAKGSLRIYCGRGSPLGNPHVMRGQSIAERNRVCDLYESEFGTPDQLDECRRIRGWAKTMPVELECFCAPKRCHCDFVRKFILEVPVI